MDTNLNRPSKLRKARIRKGFGLFWIALVISLLVHALSYLNLKQRPMWDTTNPNPKNNIKVTMQPTTDDIAQKIAEAKLKPTEPPKDAAYLGAQNHQAKKQTRVSQNIPRPKGADAGEAGPKGSKRPNPQTEQQMTDMGGKFLMQDNSRPYEKFLPLNTAGNPNAGYVDYLDDPNLEEGDAVDINTREYRFLGYFTQMRKAIELTWVYPMAAVRSGLQGKVDLQFKVARSGELTFIKVRKTSGFKILDDAIVEAIKLAQPFGKLPASYEKEVLLVNATFVYQISNSIAH